MLTAGWQLLHVILRPQSTAIRNLKGHPVSLRIWCRIIYTFLFSLSLSDAVLFQLLYLFFHITKFFKWQCPVTSHRSGRLRYMLPAFFFQSLLVYILEPMILNQI